MKPKILFLSAVAAVALISVTYSCRNDKIITFRSLLKEISDPDAITRFPDPSYRLVQFSSYDRRSISPDSAGWFANNDYTQFIREEENGGRHEYVMFEADGPGAIVRWWMTFGNLNAFNSYVRVYIDGQDEPVLEGNAPALVGGGMLVPWPLSTSVSPLTDPHQRGYDLYLPLPFAKKCKITLENDSIVITPERRYPSVYYSVSARIYEKGTRVISLRKEAIDADSLAVAECAAILSGTKADRAAGTVDKNASGIFPPGASCNFYIRERGKAITSLSLRLSTGSSDTAEVLRKTIILLTFDGRQTVSVPAASFFGTSYRINPYITYFSSTDDSGNLAARHLMPFCDSCEINIVNTSESTIAFSVRVSTAPYRWNRSSMYFGASWHEYKGIETAGAESTGGTGKHRDLNISDLSGKGVYAGDAIAVINTADAWWGEGDEKIYVDGEAFPSSFGTGTEDYYGYAWCRSEPFSHPFIAQPAGYGNFHPGMTANMRYRVLDAIPFNKSLRADIELWHWVRTIIDYGVTSYYYLLP
jgi:hypothetical protein